MPAAAGTSEQETLHQDPRLPDERVRLVTDGGPAAGSHDLVPTDNPEEADVLLLNTCSIREKAQEKVFHQLGRWKQLKQKNPN